MMERLALSWLLGQSTNLGGGRFIGSRQKLLRNPKFDGNYSGI